MARRPSPRLRRRAFAVLRLLASDTSRTADDFSGMALFKHRQAPDVLASSEDGLFELVGRRSDLPPRETIIAFRDLVSRHMAWADSRKARFRRRASAVKISSLALTAAATVVLGIGASSFGATVALPLVAMVTLLTAIDGYFGWRPRWVLMQETQTRLNSLWDNMDYYLVTSAAGAEDRTALERFQREEHNIWTEVDRRWVAAYKLDIATPDHPHDPARSTP
jgi:hypothetical protein